MFLIPIPRTARSVNQHLMAKDTNSSLNFTCWWLSPTCCYMWWAWFYRKPESILLSETVLPSSVTSFGELSLDLHGKTTRIIHISFFGIGQIENNEIFCFLNSRMYKLFLKLAEKLQQLLAPFFQKCYFFFTILLNKMGNYISCRLRCWPLLQREWRF